MFRCEWCHQDYSTKYGLNQHKNVSKLCIDIQTKNGIIPVNLRYHHCCKCNKKFTVKSNYERHVKVCKYDVTDDDLNLQVEQIQTELNQLKTEYKEKVKQLELEIKSLQEIKIE